MTREMCSGRLEFSTSKKIARRLEGKGRTVSGSGILAANAGSGVAREVSMSGGSIAATGIVKGAGAGGVGVSTGRVLAAAEGRCRARDRDELSVAGRRLGVFFFVLVTGFLSSNPMVSGQGGRL
jgi:hypothetical protein